MSGARDRGRLIGFINGKVFATGAAESVVPPVDQNTIDQPLEIPDIAIVRQP